MAQLLQQRDDAPLDLIARDGRCRSQFSWPCTLALPDSAATEIGNLQLTNFRRQVSRSAPDLCRTVAVDLPLAADRVAHVLARSATAAAAARRLREAAGQRQQVAASHGQQVIGLRRQVRPVSGRLRWPLRSAP